MGNFLGSLANNSRAKSCQVSISTCKSCIRSSKHRLRCHWMAHVKARIAQLAVLPFTIFPNPSACFWDTNVYQPLEVLGVLVDDHTITHTYIHTHIYACISIYIIICIYIKWSAFRASFLRRKSARRCGAKHISKWKCTKHTRSGPLLEVAMSKKCTPLWREAHFQVKSVNNWRSRTTFGGSDVEKVSKKCTPLWREAHFEVKSVKNWGFWAFFDVQMSKR